MATITIDPNYGYVLLAASTSFIVAQIHGINTGKYRAAAKVGYPAAYAPSSRTDKDAFLFNCAQRAHANYIENLPSFLGALLLAGIKFPITAAIMGLGWSVSRYMYMVGYCNGTEGGKGRYNGIAFYLFQAGLFGLTIWNGVTMVLGK